VSRLRWTLVALLLASTALFAVGAIAERSGAHKEPGSAETQERDESGGAAHNETGEAGEAGEKTDEAVLGVNVESTPLVVLAVIVGLALVVLAATRFGELASVLTAIALITLAWAALDVREVLHQADESRTGIALVAAAVALLHVAAAVIAGRLAAQSRVSSPGRAGTMPA
jgi:hypothetical protein